jgi:hypothetical protein
MPATSCEDSDALEATRNVLNRPVCAREPNSVGVENSRRRAGVADNSDAPPTKAEQGRDQNLLGHTGLLADPSGRVATGRRRSGPVKNHHAKTAPKGNPEDGSGRQVARTARTQYDREARDDPATGSVTTAESQKAQEAEETTESSSPWTGSDQYGSSDEFRKWLSRNRPWLVVPEHEITPLTESWNGSTVATNQTLLKLAGWCKTCSFGPEPGSSLYCPDCHRSGYEHQLSIQRKIVGTPRRVMPEPKRVSRETLKKAARVADQMLRKAATIGSCRKESGPPCLTRRQRRSQAYQNNIIPITDNQCTRDSLVLSSGLLLSAVSEE